MKKIRSTGITGQQGVNLVERVVLDMGSVWHPTGGLEAGTDGYIEFRDPVTGEMLNLHLPVQSKATTRRFGSEDERTATYICEPEDLEYWLKGNMPIVLVVSRPSTDEAYWVSIKDYFRDPEHRRTRKVVFDKTSDCFDTSALQALLKIAASDSGGTYLAPPPRREPVYSNLLSVTRLPKRIYHAYTECADGRDVRRRLNEAGARVDEWACRGHDLISVHDLSDGPWSSICDPGTVEPFETDEWAADSADDDRQKHFAALLRECLQAKLRPLHVRFDRAEKYYHFTPPRDDGPRQLSYQSLTRSSSREVVKRYTGGMGDAEWTYYRHNAFYGRFRGFEGEWYLQIDPTYRFTSDGRTLHPNASNLLTGIKKLEKNAAVLGHVVMWASLLADPEELELFPQRTYEHLGFGALLDFESPVGLTDEEWRKTDDDPDADMAMDQAKDELSLFSDVVTVEEEDVSA